MSYRSATLSPQHYAAGWKIASSDDFNDRREINRLAIRYASLPDGREKEQLCLQLLRSFNSYLKKWTNMIVRGHLPSLRTPAGKDAAKLLRTLVKRGHRINRESLLQACRTLHLAFKQNTTDDIYDTLVMCLMRAIRKYDPHYASKVGVVVEAINEILVQQADVATLLTESAISETVGFNCVGHLRLLARRGHLVSVAGAKKKVQGYRTTANWPPEAGFLDSGPVGFVYFVPMYFRWYLHEYITSTMSSLEAQEGVLQLDYRTADSAAHNGEAISIQDLGLPHTQGNLVGRDGHNWAVDFSLVNLPLDVGTMTLDWVRETHDKLFRKLTPEERYLLYLVFVKEYKWIEVASILDCDTPTVKRQFEQVMSYLRARARRSTRGVPCCVPIRSSNSPSTTVSSTPTIRPS